MGIFASLLTAENRPFPEAENARKTGWVSLGQTAIKVSRRRQLCSSLLHNWNMERNLGQELSLPYI